MINNNVNVVSGNSSSDQNRIVNLELTVADINLVIAGLGELPAKFSIALIEKVRGQVNSQIAN